MEESSSTTKITSAPFAKDIAYTDNFTVKGVLGQGGIGRVFLAFEKDIGREVAIKELISERFAGDQKKREKVEARFLREIKVTGRLQHPNIVPVYEMGTKPDGSTFYVMKHVQGATLSNIIRDSVSDKPEIGFRKRFVFLNNLIAICQAIAFAHSKGIVHRDLKPSNIIIGEFGETIILDWGLAKPITSKDEADADDFHTAIISSDEDSVKTRDGALMGTPSSMAPEQVNPKFGLVDSTTDVYALGTLLFMLLTGQKPYRGPPELTLASLSSDEPSPSPRTFGDFVPPELAAICEKAMAKKKAERFQNASEMAHELKAYRNGKLVSIYAYTKRELLRRFISRNKIALSAAAVVLISIITGAGFALHYAADANQARDAAEQALFDVTSMSESALELSERTVHSFNTAFAKLIDDMSVFVSRLEKTGVATQRDLINFAREHPYTDAFVIEGTDGKIDAAAPEGILKTTSLPPANIEHFTVKHGEREIIISDLYASAEGHHAFTLQMQIHSKGKHNRFLTAVMVSEKVMPAAFSFDPKRSEYQVWCMDNKGYIIYDEDSRQIGKILFTDAMYANYPELLALGERIREQTRGVGTYRFFDRDGVRLIYKIAAWDTLTPVQGENWKLIVTYPYKLKQ